MKKSPAFILTVCMFFALAQLPAQHIFVDLNANGNDDGSDWPNAYVDLQDALAAAAAGDTIMVAQGTYYPTDSTDRTISFNIPDSVVILGGYDASDGSRDITANTTILSGDIGTVGDSTDNSYHVVYASDLSAATVVDGFTITEGLANGSDPHNKGGGWYSGGSIFQGVHSPVISHCHFTSNTAEEGGAIYNSYGNFFGQVNSNIAHCQFSLNVAERGGAIHNYTITASQINPIITQCDFTSNAADEGGAIYNSAAGSPGQTSPFITDCTFSQNSARNGGAMFNVGRGGGGESSPLIDNCTFSDNSATLGTGDRYGGAIYNYTSSGESSPTISNCIFEDNEAYTSGGAIYNDGEAGESSPFIDKCTFHLNATVDLQGQGGGIYNNHSNPEILNSIFSSNHANYWGGAMFNEYSNPLIINCTFSGNYAVYGKALFNNPGNPKVTNCIIWEDGSWIIYGDSAVVTYSLVAGGYPGTGNLDVDPLFVDATNGDLHLQPCSPAIDAGINDSIPPGITTDLDGNPRVFNSIVDIGAFELQEVSIPLVKMNLYVNHDATGNDTGSDWVNAYTSLQDALIITNCIEADTIFVAQGAYYPTSTADRRISFVIPDSVVVIGGFDASDGSRDITAHITVLSGDIGVAGDSTDNSRIVVYSRNVSEATVVDGFKITGGNNFGYGGGWYNDGSGIGNFSNPTIINCTFSDNTADRGGGIYNYAASGGQTNPSFTNCVFFSNHAIRDANSNGGAMYNYGNSGQSNPCITNCSFSGNTASNGGAMYNSGDSGESNPVITNCILWGNSATNSGDEIYNTSASPIITYTLIAGDDTTGAGNLDADPLFTDADNGMLYLQPGSPAFNAGINDSIPAGIITDLDGNPRIQYGTVDMGAYEFDSLYCDYVINTADSGYGSLPAIMNCTPTGGSVRFHPLLSDLSIQLTSTPLQVGEDKMIIADPQANITIDASMITRAFGIDSGVSFELEGLRIISGTAAEGSAFHASGSLILRDAIIYPNPVPGSGSKISGSGTILLEKEVLVN